MEKTCKCGKVFKQYNTLQKYCNQCQYAKQKRARTPLKGIKPFQACRKPKKRKSLFYSTVKLDILWSKAIKAKAGFRCEYCGHAGNLQAHHVVTRSNKNLRWDILNGVCLCMEHHTLSSEFSAHKKPAKFKEWFINHRGIEVYEDIQRKKWLYMKIDLEELGKFLQLTLNKILDS